MSDRDQTGENWSEASTPEPDDPRKPESPSDLNRQSWMYVFRKTLREFGDDQCTDKAAALTYYSVLALFPAAIALVSLLGVVGQSQQSVSKVLEVLKPLVSPSTLSTIKPALDSIAASHSAGVGLIVGILGALWSASGYVNAFGRAMNGIYEIDEGRPFWKLRPIMLIVTVVAVMLVALVLVMLIVSGPLATSLGSVIGLGSQAVTVWNVLKWPALILVVVAIVSILYYATPNVKQPKFRWVSPGAVVAIVIWIAASVGFALYVATFGSYDKTYGSLAGVIVGLLWLWITNLALLLGAELDSEMERGRQLQAGMAAERELQLPARDTAGIRKARKKADRDIERGRLLRERARVTEDGATVDNGTRRQPSMDTTEEETL